MLPRVLIVEDDAELRSVLTRGLREEGFEVSGVGDGGSALRALDDPPDALIIDIGLPDADGRDLCQALRANGVDAPVIFLTARDAVTDRLAGFNAGGDDYLVKPFVLDELLARVRALVRRASPGAGAQLGSIRLDPVAHALVADDLRVDLTPTEFRVLAALAATPGAVVRRRDLVRSAWPAGAIVHDNTLDVYLARLRRKLADVPGAPAIETLHGVGYRLA